MERWGFVYNQYLDYRKKGFKGKVTNNKIFLVVGYLENICLKRDENNSFLCFKSQKDVQFSIAILYPRKKEVSKNMFKVDELKEHWKELAVYSSAK